MKITEQDKRREPVDPCALEGGEVYVDDADEYFIVTDDGDIVYLESGTQWHLGFLEGRKVFGPVDAELVICR